MLERRQLNFDGPLLIVSGINNIDDIDDINMSIISTFLIPFLTLSCELVLSLALPWITNIRAQGDSLNCPIQIFRKKCGKYRKTVLDKSDIVRSKVVPYISRLHLHRLLYVLFTCSLHCIHVKCV